MTSIDTIAGTFTVQRYRELKKAYDQAVRAGYHAFLFEGEHMETTFAKYLLDFLEPLSKIK